MEKAQAQEIVRRIAQRLISVIGDEVISLAELSRAAGCDLKAERWRVRPAMKLVNQEYGAVFVAVRREGYRRVPANEGAGIAARRGLRRARNAVRTAERFATNAARFANDMTPAERRTHLQQMATCGLIAHLTLQRSVQTMPDEPAPKTDPLAALRQAIGA